MAPSAVPDNFLLENLLKRDEDDIFQASLDLEDYLELLAPIIKDAIRANGLSTLIQKLNDIVLNKDEELSSLLFSLTRDINDCIDTIDNIHDESFALNKQLSQISVLLNKLVFELIAKKKTLIKCKEVLGRINETQMVLNMCLQVLEITNKIHELIKQLKYFSALKLIDELTLIHLPKVKDFSFAVKIYDSVPHLTKAIEDESFDNLGKWLAVNLERKLETIGDRCFENIFALQDRWEKFKKDSHLPVYTPHKLNSPVELSIREPSDNYKVFEDHDLQISCSTLFDAILVYQTLGEEAKLAKLYHKEWIKKYNRVIYPLTSSSTVSSTATANVEFASLEVLNDYLKKIAAFFVMDRQINRTTCYKLRTDTNSNDLWDLYLTKLKPVLIHYLKSHKLDVDDLSVFKDLVGNFLQVMETNEYKVTELYDVLMIVFKDYYAKELVAQFRQDFLELIQLDHYMPLVVQDKQDYENVMKICWYKPGLLFAPQNVSSMPVSFPFSEDYVHYCLGVRLLIEDVISFILKHYGYDMNTLNNVIVNDIVEKVLGEEKGFGISWDLRDFIERNANNKEIVAQSFTNLEYYLYLLYEVGKLINRKLRVNTGLGIHNIDVNGRFVLRAVESLTKVRKFAEDSIFNMVDLKVRSLLDMVEYDTWTPSEANMEPSFAIKDFALFLENLFTSIFLTLPLSFRTLGLFRSFDFVAEHFLSLLKEVPEYNRTAIENFDLDISYLERSMEQYNVNRGSEEEDGSVALRSTFTELRQCIDLLKLEDYDDFVKNSTFRLRKFDRIKYEDGLKMISKMIGETYDQRTLGSGAELSPRLILPSPLLISQSAGAKFAKFSNRFKRTDQ